jgi:hypothetical protein
MTDPEVESLPLDVPPPSEPFFPPRPARDRKPLVIVAAAVLVVVIAIVIGATRSHGSGAAPAQSPVVPPPRFGVAAIVTLACFSDVQANFVQVVLDVPSGGLVDFRPAWEVDSNQCFATRTAQPFTTFEDSAYKASGYTDGDVMTLYGICAETDGPAAAYAAPGFTPSPSQIGEIRAVMILCPVHPLADGWRATLARAGARE